MGEVASAYISLLPSMRGFGAALSSGIAPQMRDAGEEGGKKFGAGMAESAKNVGATAGKLIGGALLVGVGAAAAGIASAMNMEAANDKLAAQLGAPADYAADLGKVAGSLYSNAYGDSLSTVNDAIKGVLQNGVVFEDATNEQLQSITASVLDVSTAFDQDLGGVTKAVGQMMKTGLAKDGAEALDIITRGFQQGVDKSDDFLDTLNEYGTQFRKLGINGTMATGLLSQGLKAGARDGDLVADSIKEFSIRAIDGSKTTVAAYDGLGLSAGKMAKQIAGGGPAAQKGLGTILAKLRAVKDPADQAAIATGLFGTQAEDMGEALFALDPTTAVQTMGKVKGAAATMGKTLNDNATTNIETFKRTATTAFVNTLGGQVLPVVSRAASDLATKLGPALTKLGDEFTKGTGTGGKFKAILTTAKDAAMEFGRSVVLPALTALGGFLTGTIIPAVSSFVGWLKQNHAWLAPIAVGIGTIVAGYKVYTAYLAVVAAVTKAYAAVQGVLNAVMAANPIGVIIVLIAGLAAGLIYAYKTSSTFRKVVDTAFKGVKIVIGNVVEVVLTMFRGLLTTFTTVIGGILGAAATVAEKLGLPFAKGLRDASTAFDNMARNADKKLADTAAAAGKWGDETGKKYAGGIARQKKLAAINAQAVAGGVKFALVVPSAEALGSNVATSFASGIAASSDSAVSEARRMSAAVASAAKYPLKVSSPSKVMIQLGKFVGQGFAIGIRSTTAQVADAAAKLATQMSAVFTERVKTKDSALIVRLRAEVARLGPLVKKHKSLADNLARARKNLDAAIAHRGRAADFGAAQSRDMMRALSNQTNALTKLARTREGVAEKLKAAQDKLADAVGVRNDFAASIKASVVAFGAVTGIDAAEGKALTGADIVKQLRDRLVAATKFTIAMARLKRLGLNQTAYRQLVDAGVEGGGASAAALLAGGKGVVATVNNLQAKLAAQGAQLGVASSRTLFQAGVDSATGLVRGLASQSKALAAAARTLATRLVAAVKRALGIRSPSKLMESQVGKFIPLGIVAGIDAERSALDASMRSLVQVPRSGSLDFASPAARAQAAGGIDYDRLAQAMSKVQLGLDGRNVTASVDQRLGAGIR